MPVLVLEPELEAQLRGERRRSGVDRFDEVWGGVYVVAPDRDDEHQRLVTDFVTLLVGLIDFPGLGDVRAGICVSDRARGWRRDYRFPDVALRLDGSSCRNLKTHWLGGPDFLVEIITRGDRTRQKLDFYAAIGTRELLIVDRDPWALELYSLRDGHFAPTGVSRIGSPGLLVSEILPLMFRLVDVDGARKIEVAHHATGRSWMI